VAVGVRDCGAGCTLGDIIGAWIVFAASFELLGVALPSEYVADFTLGFAFGIAFRYFSIAAMRDLDLGAGIIAALKVDTLSLTAWRNARDRCSALLEPADEPLGERGSGPDA
jgi:Domain of unknown function (DUF4396)